MYRYAISVDLGVLTGIGLTMPKAASTFIRKRQECVDVWLYCVVTGDPLGQIPTRSGLLAGPAVAMNHGAFSINATLDG